MSSELISVTPRLVNSIFTLISLKYLLKHRLIPTLYNSLKNEGVEFPAFTPDSVSGGATSTNPTETSSYTTTTSSRTQSSNNDRITMQEDEDLARGIYEN